MRCAARGSGAGSLVNYLLGVSGVDPIRHGLLMERFLSPLREALPDIDIDVESARRLEVYEAILDRYGGERCVCVSMMDTYRVRHAVRDVGGALGMPPGEIDAIAKAFPHIRARDARVALRELPELRAGGLTDERLDLMFQLVERLDGLPRHVAMHPCGVLLSDATLLDRTPVEASFAGFPMSQFDKDDVEDLGLLKLDVLGIRMQSAMAHAVAEIQPHRRGRDRPRRRGAGAVRRRAHLPDDQLGPDPRRLPDRVARPARADRQVRHRDVRRHHHRHLAVPARPGQERHDHALPRGQAGLEDAALPPRRPAPDPRADQGRGGLPRAADRDDRPAHRGEQRRGRRGTPRPRRHRGHGRGAAVVPAPGAGPRLPAAAGRAALEGDRGVRVVRLLQGARGGVRAADLPVRLAEDPLAGPLPRRGAHPRPRHVPQAADPRGRPPARHRRARARRRHLREGVRRGAGARRADRLRHPARARRGEGDQHRRGGADRRRPALPVPHRLLAPGAGVPADRGAAGADRRLRPDLLDRRRRRGAGPGPGHPARPAAPDRRAGAAREGRREGVAGPGLARRVAPGRRSRVPTTPGCATAPTPGPGSGPPTSSDTRSAARASGPRPPRRARRPPPRRR